MMRPRKAIEVTMKMAIEDPHDSNQDTSTCDEDEDSDFDEDKYFSRVEEIQKRPWKGFQL